MNEKEMKTLGDELMGFIANKAKVDVVSETLHPTLKRKAYSMIDFSDSKWNLWFMTWEGKDFYLLLFDGKSKYVLEVDMRRVQFDGIKYKWVLGHHKTFANIIAKKYAEVQKDEILGETWIDSGYLLYNGVSKNEMMERFIDLLATVMGEPNDEIYEMDSEEAVEGYMRDSKTITYSRNRELSKKCKKRDDYTCQACDVKICIGGKYIIEAHHTNPLPNGIRNSTLDDFVSLCPNCHRIAHLRKTPYSPKEIRGLRKCMKS